MLIIELCDNESYFCNLGSSNYQQITKYIHVYVYVYVYINIVDNKPNLKLFEEYINIYPIKQLQNVYQKISIA